MFGHEARGATIKEGNTVGPWGLGQRHKRRVRREACTCAARGADAAHRSDVRWDPTAIAEIIVIAIAVLMHMFLSGGGATLVRLAERHQLARIAA